MVSTWTKVMPQLRSAWSYSYRCAFCTITSFFIPSTSVGIACVAPGLASAMHAAVPSVSADAAPADTSAASQCSFSARYSPAFRCSSSRRTGCRAAASTAARTGGGITAAVRNVYVPAALMILVTPSLS